ASLTIVFLLAVVTLQPFAIYAGAEQPMIVLLVSAARPTAVTRPAPISNTLSGNGVMTMTVPFDESAPGRAHFEQAITYDGPGYKFVRIAHDIAGRQVEHSAEVLYGGAGMLIEGGPDDRMTVIRTMDAALSRGRALLEVITEHPALERLTIQRYYLCGGRFLTDSQFIRETFGHNLELFAVAERDRQQCRSHALRHAQAVIDGRRAEGERIAAKVREDMKTRAYWMRSHRDQMAKAAGARRRGEHKWHAYALDAAAFARRQAAALT
ncbi:hypothetical protein, partial [Streptomyces decoyicus]